MSHINAIDDAYIVSLLFARNETALRLVDEKYRSLLLTLMRHILHDEQDAEECLNDTYLDTWNTIPPSRPRVLGAYLVTIARRRALNVYRRRTRQKRGGQAMTVALRDDFSAEDDVTRQEEDAHRIGELISDYLRTQSDHRRRMFLAYYYLHRSTADIARDMGLSRSAVQKQLAGIKRELRTILESEDITL